MEEEEDFFLDISRDGGINFAPIKNWIVGKDFENNERHNATVEIDGEALSSSTVIRIRMDASSNGDLLYIDDISLIACKSECNPGQSCDDRNPCTTDDTFDANCNCRGIEKDSDNDGICDAKDLCPGGNDRQDENQNGIPDRCEEKEDDCEEGKTCDDNDPCTLDDRYNENCECKGFFIDTDQDGICNKEDKCPFGNDNEDDDKDGIPNACDDTLGECKLGKSCNDGDECTENDVYDANCNCHGTLIDKDGDGICAALDPNDENGCIPDNGHAACLPCAVMNEENFELNMGIWIDGGSDAFRTTTHFSNANYCVALQDNSNSSNITTESMDFSAFSIIEVTFSYYAVSFDNEREDFWLQISKDGGQTFETVEEWNYGDEFENNKHYSDQVRIKGPFPHDIRLRFQCDASTNSDDVFLDNIVISGCGLDDSCQVGTSCDDGDDCTEEDIVNAFCECKGLYIDQDQDGFCKSDDPDDNDSCVPEPCDICKEIDKDDFEEYSSIWIDGGSDAFRVFNPTFANSGKYSYRLRDNSGSASSIYTKDLDLSSYTSLKIEFKFYAFSMEEGEKFVLEISTDGGTNYSTYQEWVSELDFQNGFKYSEEVEIEGRAFSNKTRIRFRCDANSNSDLVFIDDIGIEGCGPDIAAIHVQAESRSNTDAEEISQFTELRLYPNPVINQFKIEGLGARSDYTIVNANGQLVQEGTIFRNVAEVSELLPGLYFVQVDDQSEIKTLKFIKR
jgi:hypothetical protein